MDNKEAIKELVDYIADEHKLTISFEAITQARNALEEIQQYKQLEEQGLLLRLPCKVGDEFWVIAYSSKVITHVKCSGYTIQEDTRNGVKNEYIWLDSLENSRDYWKLDFEDFKEQCFSTREEAEQALEKMKGE